LACWQTKQQHRNVQSDLTVNEAKDQRDRHEQMENDLNAIVNAQNAMKANVHQDVDHKQVKEATIAVDLAEVPLGLVVLCECFQLWQHWMQTVMARYLPMKLKGLSQR
jgi:hypothetical protein